MPFKIYPHLEGEELPGDIPSSGVPALASPPAQVEGWVPTRLDLARLFYFAAGITKRGAFPGGEIYFRAAACTGALYHIVWCVVICRTCPPGSTTSALTTSPCAGCERGTIEGCWSRLPVTNRRFREPRR